MPEDLALITGAGRGIGHAIALRIATAGIPVVLVARTSDEITELRNDIIGHGGKAYATPCDIGISTEVNALRDDVLSDLGSVTILINNAGIAPTAKLAETTDDLWRDTFAVNVDGAFYATRAFLPAMLQRGGHVVSIASTAALEGFRYTTAYTASKHALLGLMRALTEEFKNSHVKFSTICPGFTRTQILTKAMHALTDRSGKSQQDAEAIYARLNREGRLIEPAEIAETVFRIIAASDLVSGLAYHADGTVIENA